jgi:HPt (histidine-containing phosphotransfer) domain-containing protein
MARTSLPNDAIAELVRVLGTDNTRTLVRTFLRDFPIAFEALSVGDRGDRHRRAHSMKSSSRLMGAHALSLHLADLESRLAESAETDISQDEMAQISRMYEDLAAPLREFVNA